MGKRQRRRRRDGGSAPSSSTTDYFDADGNILTLRDSISAATLEKIGEPPASAAASAEDTFRRRTELLFERLAVRWYLYGLLLEGQAELLGRYRMADRETQDWVGRAITEHLRLQGGGRHDD